MNLYTQERNLISASIVRRALDSHLIASDMNVLTSKVKP